MTQKETQANKELLFKDLCARLPYGVIGKCEIDASYDTPFEAKLQNHRFNAEVYGIPEEGLLFVTPLIKDQDVQEFANEEVANGIDILDFKPYLFPLLSMTEEQKEEYNSLRDLAPVHNYEVGNIMDDMELYDNWRSIDYLNANHFDYRGLIEDGLAIHATGLNIYC